MNRSTAGYGRSSIIFAVLVLAGCTTVKAVWAPLAPQSEAARTVRQADTLGRAGQHAVARDLYQHVIREYPADPARAEALYRLGVQQSDPASPLRDYRAARAIFTRLLAEYPRSRWDAEARAWQAVLTDLLVREEEARRANQRHQRSEEESRRIKMKLERLKQTDLDLELRR